MLLNHANRAEELAQSLERVILALNRDQNGIGGRERVEREEPEARRRIDEDEIVIDP